jgi:chaperonin GroES
MALLRGSGHTVRSVPWPQVGKRLAWVEVRSEEYLILRERDIHAVASDRNDDGTGLYL